ncbi:MAG: ion transporter [Reyranella sp.]|uniref:cyclic nucleotide-gated ion channel n=1 Tax=Reyranella sp. TaxID=1929291 RepID=UPI00273065B4|nr:cyclic nucleotide-gated ion channel [Reyranella sp.]MDP1961246.1 ion transporter [Reyranella sp.]MDP2377715.1 ion transporter [Reyranella sp.]
MLHLAVLGIGILAVIILSMDDIPPDLRHALRYAISSVAIVFFVEYVLRVWVAPEAARYRESSPAMARLHWAVSLPGLIGLLATVPVFMWLAGYRIVGSDAASIFCVLWILKLGLHAPALSTLARVISNERAPIASVLILFLILLVIAATGAHLLEREHQPAAFGSLPNALWWAVVTLTTTGYGDVVPLTAGGRMVGSVLMISGITVLAIMTGVLATGFAQEERRREYLRVWEQVARVPIFTSLGVVTLSEIVGKLRTRYYPSRITIVRRGDPGDSMFFISSGEVEVRLPTGGTILLGEGAFFGEMALLERQPRSAMVATTRPTTLLVLYASDFYEIASHIPALAEVVENEAKRRRNENIDRTSGAPKR